MSNCKVSCKILEFVNLEPKMSYLSVWRAALEIYCHFWNQCSLICFKAKFGAETKILKFWTKNAWFEHFWTGIWKQYCHIWNHDARVCLAAKFHEKMKMPKFGTKNGLFGLNFKKLLLYLKSTPSNLPNCKILWKNENA